MTLATTTYNLDGPTFCSNRQLIHARTRNRPLNRCDGNYKHTYDADGRQFFAITSAIYYNDSGGQIRLYVYDADTAVPPIKNGWQLDPDLGTDPVAHQLLILSTTVPPIATTCLATGFTAKERDPETGLDYFFARYMSPAQGRFTSPDPENAGARALDPQSWNMYSYAGNNPLRYVDPFGLAYEICDVNGENCGTYSDKLYHKLQKDNNFLIANGNIYARNKNGTQGDLLGSVTDKGRDLEERGQEVAGGLGARVDASNQFIGAFAGGSTLLGVAGGVIAASSGLTAITGAPTLGLQVGTAVETTAVAASSGITLDGAALHLSKEAVRRMGQRGFTNDMVQAVVRNGTRYWDPKNHVFNYVLRGGFASGKDALVGVNPVTNVVTTVIRGTNLVSSRFIPF